MIKNDTWITEMAASGLIHPFEPKLVRQVNLEDFARPVICYCIS